MASDAVVSSPAPLGRWPSSDRSMGIGMIMPISDISAFGPMPRFSDMLAMARTAEDAGYDAIWVPDHFVFDEPDDGPRGVWEGWTALAALAAGTRTITIGSFVTCLVWRNPGIVAKMAENLDEISGGRFVLGAGAGWHRPEYDMFGLPWDHRYGRFEDAIRIIGPLLREGRADHQGEFWQARDAVNLPRGPRGTEGGPPILVGTGGEKMLRLTARFADAWNTVWHPDPAALVQKIEEVERACQEVGRDPATLVKTVGSNVAMPGYLGRRLDPIEGDAEQVAKRVAGFRQLGFRHWVAGLDPCTPSSIEEFSRVVEILDRT
jgi:alkanesulfonate monooxygenase SsuD/methylene tetrahydromethanopterin reductase-like flavin-dependent oxidoreductase (luciferase family)